MKSKVIEIIERSIDELNEQLDADAQIVFSDELRFIGKKAAIDSMSLVTLISIIEDLIADELDSDISIVSSKAFSQERSPFYSVDTLAEFIVELLEEEK